MAHTPWFGCAFDTPYGITVTFGQIGSGSVEFTRMAGLDVTLSWRHRKWAMLFRGRVFIAHAADAKEFARRLAARLEAAGYPTFLDERRLHVGEAYDLIIEDAVKSCGLFLFVVSGDAVTPGSYALTELEWAVAAGRRVMGVYADGHDHVLPPPEVGATTFLRSRGDRAARVVAEVRHRLGGGGQRSRRVWSIVLGLAVLFVAWGLQSYLQKRPLGGAVYDKHGRPLPGVAISLVGAGTVAVCPQRVTDEQGGFLFADCATASRIENPRVSVRPVGRGPCEAEIPLMAPPKMTFISIDPSTPSCHPSSSVAAPAPVPPDSAVQPDTSGCAIAVRDSIRRLALAHDLKVQEEFSDSSRYQATIWSGSASLSDPPDVAVFARQCVLFTEKYSVDTARAQLLQDYLWEISMDARRIDGERLIRSGFSEEDVAHLEWHLTALSPPSGVPVLRLAYSERTGFEITLSDSSSWSPPTGRLSGAQLRELRRVGEQAARCERQN